MVDAAPNLLIDGYNLLLARQAHGAARAGAWEEVRAEFLAWLAERVADPAKVTVVFDAPASEGVASPKGRHGKRASRQSIAGLKVLFAAGYRSADDLIEELCTEAAAAGRRWLVVSNDRQVQRAARSCRFPYFGSNQFLATLERQADRPTTAQRDDNRPESAAADNVDFWMKEFAFDAAALANEQAPPPVVEPAKPPIPELDDPFLQKFLDDMHAPLDTKAPQRGRRQRQQKKDE